MPLITGVSPKNSGTHDTGGSGSHSGKVGTWSSCVP